MEPLATATFKVTKPIVLVGMMGVGKTTYGKKIAAVLSIPFVDIDVMIENDIGHSVSWIFENAGEEKFRKMEVAKIKEVLDEKEPAVIALGGGAFLNETTRNLIKEKAFSIWLRSSAEVIYSRVSVRKDRPLLEGVEDKLGKIKEIMNTREQYYKQADIFAFTDTGNPKLIIINLIEQLLKYIKNGKGK